MTHDPLFPPTEAMIDAETKAVMDNAYADLRSFKPWRHDAKTVIVPINDSFGLDSQLRELEEVCGFDRELWRVEKGYFVLEHP